jgi:hypothetical protein
MNATKTCGSGLGREILIFRLPNEKARGHARQPVGLGTRALSYRQGCIFMKDSDQLLS